MTTMKTTGDESEKATATSNEDRQFEKYRNFVADEETKKRANATWFPPFSNCFDKPAAAIVVKGQHYRSTEHFYQSCKFLDKDSVIKVLNAPTPMKAKKLANKLVSKSKKYHESFVRGLPDRCRNPDNASIILRPENEWDAQKESVMLVASLAKYRQNAELQNLLLSTGEEYLLEPNYKDEYWGCGKNGVSGRNRLGHVLMEVRSKIRAESASNDAKSPELLSAHDTPKP